MVRGRRVRPVVACTRNEDCCSPLPKRKDQANINGKLSHTPNNKNQTITQFFQSVECDLNKSIPLMHTESMLIEDSNDLDDTEKEEFKEIITTPLHTIAKSNKSKNYLNDLLSPPTPHRIEFCLEEEEEKIRNGTRAEDDDELSPKKMAPPPKSRRRLNNLTSNQQLNGKTTSVANNHKLTDFFPVRRSVRKTNKVVLEEKQRSMECILRKNIEVGLRVENFEEKGRGIIADQLFNRGDFVVEYAGDLIDIGEAKRRELKYAQDQNTGCYMYYFKHKSQQYCIDATAETGRLGRLVNHSRNGNLMTRTVDVDCKPRLILIAKDTIQAGHEVTYDYGDRSKESLKHHPWLAY